MPPAPKEPLNWSKVEAIQTRSFYGNGGILSPDESKLCQRAIDEDPERYRKFGESLRENYRKSLRGE